MLQLSKRMPAYIIYIFVEIPPKMSISSFVGYLKGKSALMIFERFSHLKYNYGVNVNIFLYKKWKIIMYNN